MCLVPHLNGVSVQMENVGVCGIIFAILNSYCVLNFVSSN